MVKTPEEMGFEAMSPAGGRAAMSSLSLGADWGSPFSATSSARVKNLVPETLLNSLRSLTRSGWRLLGMGACGWDAGVFGDSVAAGLTL